MEREGNIVRYTAEEAKHLPSKTDWARLDAQTEEDILAQISRDPDEAGWEPDWDTMMTTLPPRKAAMHMRIDADVLDHFRRGGRGYQTRINAVLRAYVEAEKRRAG